ncbi:MAG: HAD family hydrolase [Bacteroidales bacterium]|nr:HAD family hydrolase [Bacteroidales bacterium]
MDDPQKRYLFLDRDGVINERIIGGYVTMPGDFVFLQGVTNALKILSGIFERIFIVTNQQGIGKGIMTEEQLRIVHEYMLKKIEKAGGRIDNIYYAPYLELENHPFRKPNTGMALQAQKDFPEVDFKRSVMVGDSKSDMLFGKALGMETIFVSNEPEIDFKLIADLYFRNLPDYAKSQFLDNV